MKWKWFVDWFLLYSFFMGFTKTWFMSFSFQESGSSVQDDQCPLQLQPHHPHGSWRWHPDSEAHGSSHHPGDRRSGETWLTMAMFWDDTVSISQVGHSSTSPSPMAGSQPVQRVKSMFGQSTGKLPPPRLPAHPPPPQRSISHSEVSSMVYSVWCTVDSKWRTTLTVPITLC